MRWMRPATRSAASRTALGASRAAPHAGSTRTFTACADRSADQLDGPARLLERHPVGDHLLERIAAATAGSRAPARPPACRGCWRRRSRSRARPSGRPAPAGSRRRSDPRRPRGRPCGRRESRARARRSSRSCRRRDRPRRRRPRRGSRAPDRRRRCGPSRWRRARVAISILRSLVARPTATIAAAPASAAATTHASPCGPQPEHDDDLPDPGGAELRRPAHAVAEHGAGEHGELGVETVGDAVRHRVRAQVHALAHAAPEVRRLEHRHRAAVAASEVAQPVLTREAVPAAAAPDRELEDHHVADQHAVRGVAARPELLDDADDLVPDDRRQAGGDLPGEQSGVRAADAAPQHAHPAVVAAQLAGPHVLDVEPPRTARAPPRGSSLGLDHLGGDGRDPGGLEHARRRAGSGRRRGARRHRRSGARRRRAGRGRARRRPRRSSASPASAASMRRSCPSRSSSRALVRSARSRVSSTPPGATTLTRMPRGPSSTAASCASAVAPALAAA